MNSLLQILKITILSILSTGFSSGCGDNANNAESASEDMSSSSPTENGIQCDCDLVNICDDCQNDRLVFVSREYSLAEIANFDSDPKIAFEKACKYLIPINEQFSGKKFDAFISYSNLTPIDFLEKTTGNYVLLDGTVIAIGRDDLLDGELKSPINVTALDENIASRKVWTGTLSNGLGTDNFCKNWQITTAMATVGNTNFSDMKWASDDVIDCDQTAGIYCIERLH